MEAAARYRPKYRLKARRRRLRTRQSWAFDRQAFDASVADETLRFAPPDYAPAYDFRNKLTPEEKLSRIEQLARAGDPSAKVRLAYATEFDPAAAKPKVQQFAEGLAKLTEAESLRFGPAYVYHAQLLQPDNREWFSADLKKLPDAELRRQRAVLFEGAWNCAAEAAQSLLMNQIQPPTPAEKEQLMALATACNEKQVPSDIRALQVRLDAGETVEGLVR